MRGNYRRLAVAAAAAAAALPLGAASEKIDYEAINKIKAAGHERGRTRRSWRSRAG